MDLELARAYRRLELMIAARGIDDPDVAEILHVIASMHHDAGRLEDARGCYEDVIAIREGVLGAEHPAVAQTLEDLAALCHDLGDEVRSSELLSRAREIRAAYAARANGDVRIASSATPVEHASIR